LFLSNNIVDYHFAQQQFKKQSHDEWLAYVLGCALVLQKEKGISFKGASFEIKSNVPLGKGVSSSASLEVATMKALAKAFQVSFEGTELPRLAQRVENLIVGAPCGLMDQLASYYGEPKKLLPIVCQPDKIQTPVPIPDDIFFLGIDSGIRHFVGEASYTDVRCAAFMGYTIILHSLGIDSTSIKNAKATHDYSSLPFKGYLCNIDKAEFDQKFKQVLPNKMKGSEFITRYGSTLDTITEVKPSVDYAILNCTMHPIYENKRVAQFKNLLERAQDQPIDKKEMIREMGQLMYASHESYSSCGLGSHRTDELVALAKQHFNSGIMGAKITGGGSGGTVCLLAFGEDGKNAVHKLHQQFSETHNAALTLFEM
jgi:L-arabinokinase